MTPRPQPLSEFSFQYYFFLPLNPLKSTWPWFSDFSPIRKLGGGGGGQLNSLLNQLVTLEHCFSSIHFYSWATRKSMIFHRNHMLGTGCTVSDHWLPWLFTALITLKATKLPHPLHRTNKFYCDGCHHNPTPHTWAQGVLFFFNSLIT